MCAEVSQWSRAAMVNMLDEVYIRQVGETLGKIGNAPLSGRIDRNDRRGDRGDHELHEH